MVWFKIDDGFWSHSKVLELSPEAGWLWTRAGSYCANQLTDGKVTPAALRMLSADRDSATELVLAGLWDLDSEGCWWFHDWAEYQPTREQVLTERAAATERKRVSRENARRKSQGESQRDSRGTDAVIPGSPTRPDPTRPSLSSNEERERTPFCEKHPQGTDQNCRGCANARIAFTAHQAAEKLKPTPIVRRPVECSEHEGWPLPCDKCDQIAREEAIA